VIGACDEDADFAGLDPADFIAEMEWDGIRVQASRPRRTRHLQTRLYSRSGEDITKSFPPHTLAALPGAVDANCWSARRRVQTFNVTQQRLTEKSCRRNYQGISDPSARLPICSPTMNPTLRELTFGRAPRAAGGFPLETRRSAH